MNTINIKAKVIARPAVGERDAYIQVNTWTRPDGGPWVAIKDKTSGVIFGWRHYYATSVACEEQTGITPPPAASISLDGGVTWSPLKGVNEPAWVSDLKVDAQTDWRIRREGGKLLARKAK